MNICENLYCYLWERYEINNANSYLIGKESSYILIDPGRSQFVDELLRKIEKDGINISKIKFVIFTHSHPDHMEGCYFFNGKASILIHEDEFDFLQGEGLYFYGENLPECEPDFFLKEGVIEFFGLKIHVIHTPGHTPGSISLYIPEKKALISGDFIFYHGVGRTDFPGSSPELMAYSFKKIEGMEIDYLLPGHGPIVSGRSENILNLSLLKEIIL